ncbi:DUF3134 domain-containing protein [Cronbergia sp. UHCC 0137]|uniref:DUF3134 domain-containing protein n=1 Tax=Cronbergia sp. UHCC 0137 TaxID=3110239 RepID=UPI002B1FE772|nr:DUF3134 domain-containing protein [Cronbergia sp. UHCC 0137]MEA5618273.1 DUF3134 domain-containing protein [Cronbergia sp. UHCC 0137]
MLNSPIYEAPRNQRAAVIPLKPESSMVDWLLSKGRLVAREVHEQDLLTGSGITDLLGGEDGIPDLDYDDDEISIEEE